MQLGGYWTPGEAQSTRWTGGRGRVLGMTLPCPQCPDTGGRMASSSTVAITRSYPTAMATTLLPEYHGNHIPLPTVLWQPLSYHPQHRGNHSVLTTALRRPHSITHSRTANHVHRPQERGGMATFPTPPRFHAAKNSFYPMLQQCWSICESTYGPRVDTHSCPPCPQGCPFLPSVATTLCPSPPACGPPGISGGRVT